MTHEEVGVASTVQTGPKPKKSIVYVTTICTYFVQILE